MTAPGTGSDLVLSMLLTSVRILMVNPFPPARQRLLAILAVSEHRRFVPQIKGCCGSSDPSLAGGANMTAEMSVRLILKLIWPPGPACHRNLRSPIA